MDVTMASEPVPDFLKLLAHDLRWKIVTLLARGDYNGQEFVRLLEQPQNLISYHLRKLHEQHLVREHRSTADERSIYYSLDLDKVRSLYNYAPLPAMMVLKSEAQIRALNCGSSLCYKE